MKKIKPTGNKWGVIKTISKLKFERKDHDDDGADDYDEPGYVGRWVV